MEFLLLDLKREPYLSQILLKLRQIGNRTSCCPSSSVIILVNFGYNFSVFGLACLPSVSSRVIVQKLEREQKKKNVEEGRGRGEEETLARKPHDSGKRPLIFHGSVHL